MGVRVWSLVVNNGGIYAIRRPCTYKIVYNYSYCIWYVTNITVSRAPDRVCLGYMVVRARDHFAMNGTSAHCEARPRYRVTNVVTLRGEVNITTLFPHFVGT